MSAGAGAALALLGSPQADAAAIAGAVALLGAWYTHWRTASVQRELKEKDIAGGERLAEINSRLAQGREDRNARRDYEYQARQRLYGEVQPLLFQLHEAAEKAHFRVRSLARTSREGNLDSQRSWLAVENYYARSTLYNLLLPAVFFRLIQRKLTFVDMDVDRAIRAKYELVKLYFLAWTDHYEFARLAPVLDYDPDRAGPRAEGDGAVRERQGLVLGHAEQIVEAMIVSEGGQARPVTYSEFESIMSAPDRSRVLARAANLILGFNPLERPVLARMLLGLAAIAWLIRKSHRTELAPGSLSHLLETFKGDPVIEEELAWSTSGGALDCTFNYLQPKIAQLISDDSLQLSTKGSRP